MIRRTSLLARLTAAYSLAVLLVLVGASTWVALRLRGDLDDRVDEDLAARGAAALDVATSGGDVATVPVDEPQEGFVQLLAADGRVIGRAGSLPTSSLTRSELASARSGHVVVVERVLPGVDGTTRVRALAVTRGPEAGGVLVVGQSLVDRDEAVASVVRSFAVVGAIGVAVAALVGWWLARAALRPVGESIARERRFVADASHEIRTPLTVVRTELETALRSPDLPGVAREAIEAAHAESGRLGRLADDLLVLARLDDGRVPLRPVDVGVESLVGSVRDAYADRAAAEGRYLAVAVDVGLTVRADPDRLRQLLTNLVDNALTHGDGTVTVTAQREAGDLELWVDDEGPGLGPDIAAHAFRPFSRAPAAAGGGAGLGLALVSAIARAHGGVAWIDADRGRVVVRLPGADTVEPVNR